MEQEQTTMEERFDEKFPYYRKAIIGNTYNIKEIKSFIQSEIDLAVAERDREILEIINENIEITNQFSGEGIVTPDMKSAILLVLKDVKNAIVNLITKKQKIDCPRKKQFGKCSVLGCGVCGNIRLSNQEVSNRLQDIEDNTSPLDRE